MEASALIPIPYSAYPPHLQRELYYGDANSHYYEREDYQNSPKYFYNGLRFHSKAESLEMGVYLDSDTFVSEFKYMDQVYFVIDYQYRNIKIEFGVPMGSGSQVYKFKLELDFKNLNGEIHVEQDKFKKRSQITIASKFPARYWINDIDKKCWKRMTKLHHLGKNKAPLQPHMPDNSELLGKCIIFRVTFIMDKNALSFHRFDEMITKAGEYNLVAKPANYERPAKYDKPLKIVDGTRLCKYVERSTLDFDVLYMTECNLSFNYLHDYNLNDQFFYLLSKQPKWIANHILENIFAEKKRIFDPLLRLRSEINEIKRTGTQPPDTTMPSHCVMMRKVVITPTTMYILPPAMEVGNRVIRNYRNKKDYFLRVSFVDEASSKVGSSNGKDDDTHNDALYNRIYNILHNGIKIGDRHYEFLAFSASQLRDHSCWFFAPTNDLTADQIRSWMGDFSKEKTVAKYAARMGQCFSSTRAIQKLHVNDIKEISDIERNGFTFSDGIGIISLSLAEKIAREMDWKPVPSAFQFRLAGYKGMLCQSKLIQDNQVQVRPSQRKFKSTHNILEIIRRSTFISAYLNRQAITLLTTLGIPDKVFIDMKDEQVNDLGRIFTNENIAINLLMKNIDEYEVSKNLADLVKAGFLQKGDSYLVNLISLFRIMMMRDLKKKAKIRVDKGAFLLGVLDETKTLRENEIYCCVSDPLNPKSKKVFEGTCIVFRNPCFHPGDIRIVKAVKCEALSNLVDVVVFPAVGYQDIPNQCSGGDLDGDDFTIIYDERLIPQSVKDPMNYKSQKPETVDSVSMNHIKTFFVNYVFSDQLGKIANAHLAKADSFPVGAAHGQCIRLAQLHSDAVDFPKTGIPAKFPPELRVQSYPDFMEKPDKPSYESKKVLGVLYRSINVAEFEPSNDMNFDERLRVEGYEPYLENARKLKRDYDADIKGLMNQYGIVTEFEVVSGYIVNTITKVDRKKPRDVAKSVMEALLPIKRHYRKQFEAEFYGEGEGSIIPPEALNKMEAKAFAWYFVTYHYSEFNNNKNSNENMISFPWILQDILCVIAIRNNINARQNRGGSNLLNEEEMAEIRFNTVKRQIRSIYQNAYHYSSDEIEDINDDITRLKLLINGSST